MADIVIRGIEVSKSLDIIINGNKVSYSTNNGMTWKENAEFLFLPEEHGRCIDADELRKAMYHEAFETASPMQKWESGCWIRYKMFERNLENASTIVQAEGGNADDSKL